jgi:hypothetical protein
VDLASEVVRAMATGAGESISAQAMSAVERLISGLRAKFHGDPQARGTLEIALETPDDSPARENLVSLIRNRILQDREFSEWLESLWSGVRPDLQMDASNSVNIVRGDVKGDVIQARDVHGGIHIGRQEAADRPASREAGAEDGGPGI